MRLSRSSVDMGRGLRVFFFSGGGMGVHSKNEGQAQTRGQKHIRQRPLRSVWGRRGRTGIPTLPPPLQRDGSADVVLSVFAASPRLPSSAEC